MSFDTVPQLITNDPFRSGRLDLPLNLPLDGSMGPSLCEVSMPHTEIGTRVAGVWLAVASPLLAGALVGHGPIHPDMSHQMGVIAAGPVRWAIRAGLANSDRRMSGFSA